MRIGHLDQELFVSKHCCTERELVVFFISYFALNFLLFSLLALSKGRGDKSAYTSAYRKTVIARGNVSQEPYRQARNCCCGSRFNLS